MTSSTTLAQIEEAIRHLSYDERLWLIERLAYGLRNESGAVRPSFDAALAQMAADPEIRRELAEIAQESAATELD